jgi:hypothetical protein
MSTSKIIAVGALGGSGTRAVADLLSGAGVFLGHEINKSNDTLTFTRLFKDTKWFATRKPDSFAQRFDLFEKLMLRRSMSVSDVFSAYGTMRANHTWKTAPAYWIKLFIANVLPERSLDLWGWKEPNTQMYAEELLTLKPHLKYVHVLRNGLDMAFSNNKQQLYNWGPQFGLEPSTAESQEEVFRQQLELWIRSTKRILEVQQRFPDRVYLLNLTELCTHSQEQLQRLYAFLDLEVAPGRMEELAEIPRLTSSHHRFKKFGLGPFAHNQIEFVASCGFETKAQS